MRPAEVAPMGAIFLALERSAMLTKPRRQMQFRRIELPALKSQAGAEPSAILG